ALPTWSGGRYHVVILNEHRVGEGRATGNVDRASIPEALRQKVRTSQEERQLYRQYASIKYLGRHKPEKGLIVGARVNGSYEIYHLFPLVAEERTLYSVQRMLIGTGIALLLLLAGVASLVTRQVVTPVRLTRQAAERLAAGQLEERLKVRGEDDLARLAASFNEMASNLAVKIRQLEELSQVQRQFVSDVSHELRTPLTTIRMAADVLYESRESFDPGAARAAELMQNQLERFEAMLTDLLEIK